MIDTEMSSTCIPGGSVRAFNGFQANPMMHHPQTPWQYAAAAATAHPRQEPRMEVEKNDSGINSGSDFQSSSPGSDNSQDMHPQYTSSPQGQNPNQIRFYSTPLVPKNTHPYNINQHFNHNPLTPPNSEPLVSPKSEKEEKEDITLTPCSSPNEIRNEPSGDHLRRLEISLEKFSSKVSEGSAEDETKSDNDLEEFDEKNLRIPRVNSHGKVKTFKCKQCNFVALTKLEFWEHNKTHIKEEKQLTCPKCPFVTEYKHHLEYHLRNHTGSKPFKCSKCEYSCVNKSMLNSHMKSHSNIYRYRCIDCNYATKYCHSLKIHLRKYNHSPAVVLDSEGNPCPDLIIDVHGTRRGPKVKHQNGYNNKSELEQHPMPFGLNPLLSSASQQLPFPAAYSFFNGFPNPQLLQNFQQLLRERQALAASLVSSNEPEEVQEQEDPESVLDLSKPGGSVSEHKNRRKGPAFKLDHLQVNESDEEVDDETTTTMFSNVEAVVQNKDEEVADVKSESDEETTNNIINAKSKDNTCQYCNIAFGDDVLYTMHMGYHGFKNPFSCNMCGVECGDKVAFFLHIARTPHS